MRLVHIVRGSVSGVVLLLGMTIRTTTPCIAGASLCVALTSVGVAEQKEPRREYSLPRGEAATTLRQFAEISGKPVLFMMDKVQGEQTNAINGVYSPSDALKLMLAGTNLEILREQAAQGFVVSRRQAPAPLEEVGHHSPNQPQPKSEPMTSSNPSGKLRTWLLAVLGSIGAVISPAQTTANPDTATTEKKSEEVVELTPFTVVATGTQIRGIEPVGAAQPFILDREAIATSGVVDTNQLMTKIPEMSSFNTLVQPGVAYDDEARAPQLRGLPTLILIDGHRVAGAGFAQNSPDVSFIPPALIQRVEVLTDGVSSIYGSDAIGGVVNFITRRDFIGTEVSSRYGAANGYQTFDFNITQGLNWKGGSAGLAYSYEWNSELKAASRAYTSQDQRPFGGNDNRVPGGTPGNIIVDGISYRMDTRTPGQNVFDYGSVGSIFPKERRHSLYGAFEQKLGDAVSIVGDVFWSRWWTTVYAPLMNNGSYTGTITSANPYFAPIGTETSQTVQFDFAPVFGERAPVPRQFTERGINAEIRVTLPNDWQMRFPLNYSDSLVEGGITIGGIYGTTGVDAALAGTTLATALNPYNLPATNPSVLAALPYTPYTTNTTHELISSKVIADGPLFAPLPSGKAVHLALGGEILYNNFTTLEGQRNTSAEPFDVVTDNQKRTISSGYAEVYIPLVDNANKMPALERLGLSASARVDDYSDLGRQTNPRFGVTYSPLPGLQFRGNVGSSFVAPNFGDTSTITSTVWVVPFTIWSRPGDNITDPSRPEIILLGGSRNLKPQRADTYSVGADWSAKGPLKGLTVNATYYSINYKDKISIAAFYDPLAWGDPAQAKYFTLDPTLEFVQAKVGSVNRPTYGGPNFVASDYYKPGMPTPYAFFDATEINLSSEKHTGVDMQLNYRRPTKAGWIEVGVNATKLLKVDQYATPSSPAFDALANTTSLFASAHIGAKIGRTTITFMSDYTGGYITGFEDHPRVSSFTVYGLNVNIELPEKGWSRHMSLNVGVQNVFNEDPPIVFAGAGRVSSNLGRLGQIGFTKRF